MSKAARGSKRACNSCGGKFYDLDRQPIVCPLCGTAFELEEPAPKVEIVAEPVVEAKPAVEEKPVVEEKPAAALPEFVSLDEAQAEEEEGASAIDDEELVDLGDDDAEVSTEDDKDAFLEEEDEAEPDVSGIIGGPIKSPEES